MQIVLESRNLTADWVEHERIAAEAMKNDFTVSMADQVKAGLAAQNQAVNTLAPMPSAPVAPRERKEPRNGSEAHGLLSRPSRGHSLKHQGGGGGVVRALGVVYSQGFGRRVVALTADLSVLSPQPVMCVPRAPWLILLGTASTVTRSNTRRS